MSNLPDSAVKNQSGLTPTAPRLIGHLFYAVLLAGSAALWIQCLPLANPDALDGFGLIAILPWQYWASLGLVSLSFVLSLIPSTNARWVRPVALILLIVILHATPPLVYGTLRYSWAWKHIGIVDYIQRHGDVNRTLPFLAAYHNWPGFFWLSAKAADVLNMGPLDIANVARFVPIVTNLTYVAFLGTIYRRFTDNSQVIWAALWIFTCANWVGQDYYSPQALSYGLHLLVLALCLGPLMPPRSMYQSPVFVTRSWFTQLRVQTPQVSALVRLASLALVAFAVFGIIASHQLTPLILVFSLFGLSLFTPLGFGYPILVILALVFWVIYPAAPFTSLVLPGEVADIGQTMDGVTDKMVNTSSVDRGVAIVVWGGRALAGSVVVLAFLGWLRSLKTDQPVTIICALLIAPGLVLALTSYGGEAVFRIYFFCVPFLAYFAGMSFFAKANQRFSVLPYLVFLPIMIVMAVGFILGNNGKDRQYRFSPDEVEAAHWLYAQGRPGTLLVEGDRSYPSQFMNYEYFSYVPVSRERPKDRSEIFAQPTKVLTRWFADQRWQDGYVITTRSQKAAVESLGVLPVGTLDKLELDLLRSPDFQLVFANKDARIFRASRFINPPNDDQDLDQ